MIFGRDRLSRVPMRRIVALLFAWTALTSGALAQEPTNGGGDPEDQVVQNPFREDRREEEARTLFEAGRIAFEDGRFADALASFQRAFDLSNRPLLLFNIGACLDRLQRNAEAIEAFEHYLRAQPEASNRPEVEARVRELRAGAEREREREEELRREAERRAALEAELQARDAEVPLVRKWWLWTLVGAVVAAAVITTVAILAYDPGYEDPILGSTGLVTFTLGSGP